MCGIAGILNFRGDPVDRELLDRMTGMLRYRGPDGCGTRVKHNVGLAHTRLSIIDLSSGQQPMCNEDRSLWIVCNGEIFNYLELRADLQKKGHQFSTRSDTEVILHAYEEKGEDCVHEFNGQWAFAIWDEQSKKLFLSRDRLGVRPLFYWAAPDRFVFASEIKSILAVPNVTRELDLIGLDQIFTFWFTLPPRTIFKDILEVPPGHSLIVENRRIVVRNYWQPAFPRTERNGRNEREYAEELRDLLMDATRIRLRSDVPVGAYLSGGLDSSVVTALIKKFTDTRLRTFSVVFDDPEFDESPHQREVIRFLDTDHQEIHCGYEDIGRVFPEVIWHTEKPILRTAPAPLFMLSKLVRESGFKVVLTGEGADEILGGYDIFKEAKIRRFWGSHPESTLRPLLLKRLYPYLRNLRAQSDAYLRAFFHVGTEDIDSPFFSHLPRWRLTSRLKTFYSAAVRQELHSYDPYAELGSQLPNSYSGWDPFCQAQFLETAYLLPGYILSSQGDRVAMAHSVEGRFPFLDHRVVRFASTIPPYLKMKVLDEKYLLKLCARDLVPPAVLKRPKQPYRAPEGKSFLGSSQAAYVDDLLSREQIRKDGIFHAEAVEKLMQKFRDERAIGIKDNMAITGVLSTQLVIHQFIHNFRGGLGHG